MGQGSVGSLCKVLKAKGLCLNYGRGIGMPANYVIMYNPADQGSSGSASDEAHARLSEFAAEIAAGAQSVKKLPFTFNKLYKNIETLDAGFTVSDGCTGCGLCERICPVANIRLENDRPVWLHKCERCVACISWCPARAIEYGDQTQQRRRYRNQRIRADELARREARD